MAFAEQLISESSLKSPKQGELVLSLKGVSKKFTKDLKRSMVYGLVDLSKNLIGLQHDASSLRKSEFWAVDDVSFELRRGQVLGVIGANGSGKTTLLRLIAGILPPDKGEVRTQGRITSLITLSAGFHPLMTGRENIYLNGSILGMSRGEIRSKLERIIEFSELGDFIDSPVATYSSGMRVRLGFSIAAAIQPDILLLDEVLAVGDRSFKAKCYAEIDKLSKNTAIIFISHSMTKITRICNGILVLGHGKNEYHSEDVKGGIDYYYSKFEIDKTSVSGAGGALVHDVSLFSGAAPSGASSDDFKIEYLDTLDIVVSFSLDPRILKAAMKIIFFDQEFDEVGACSSQPCNFEIDNQSKMIRVRIRVPEIPLSPGTYYLTVVIRDSDEGVVLVKYHAIRCFQVTGSFSSTAPVHWLGEWSLEP